MAKSPRPTKRRASQTGFLKRLLQLGALVGLIAIVYAAWFWFEMRSWRPDPEAYTEQGVVISAGSPPVRFETLKAMGATFVYLELGASGAAADPGFRDRMEAATSAGLKVGVVHLFDPCLRADPQSALFTRVVARDPAFLPPALAMSKMPTACSEGVSDAAVTSEVLTLVNQIEMHTGRPVILKLDEAFETRFGMANALNRDLWLVRDRLRPRYAPRPWLLWSANSQLMSEAVNEPIEWVVVQR